MPEDKKIVQMIAIGVQQWLFLYSDGTVEEWRSRRDPKVNALVFFGRRNVVAEK